MTTLDVKRVGTGGIEFSPPVPLPSNEANHEWQELAAKFLVYAFEGRPVCFVTDDERASSFSYADSLKHNYEIVVSSTTFLIAFDDAASPERFEQVVTSREFHWDAVWLLPLDKEEMWRVHQFLLTLDVRAPQSITEEVLIPIGDGCGIEWLNPNRSVADILGKLADLTRSVGWELKTAAMENPH